MRVVLAMSGGVDSSVAAVLLKEAGHDVLGVFLRNGVVADAAPGGRVQGCCSVRDACDAEEVAAGLDIPFYSLDHSREFGSIVDQFVEDYGAGRTPNPCVQCNRELKFGELWSFARAMGADRVATGHYARLSREGDGVALRRAVDARKDQSYVLALVAAEALGASCFPLGELRKDEVRQIAARAGLPVHDKPESQEICFVPTGDHRDLLRERRPEMFRPGPLVRRDGTQVGEHQGAMGFTVGQRRGLGMGGGPWFVLDSDPSSNVVTVGRRSELAQSRAELAGAQWWIPAPRPGERREYTVQLRAHHAGVDVEAAAPAEGRIEISFPAGEVVVPGQIGVLYDGDRVVAAGTVSRGQVASVIGR